MTDEKKYTKTELMFIHFSLALAGAKLQMSPTDFSWVTAIEETDLPPEMEGRVISFIRDHFAPEGEEAPYFDDTPEGQSERILMAFLGSEIAFDMYLKLVSGPLWLTSKT